MDGRVCTDLPLLLLLLLLLICLLLRLLFLLLPADMERTFVAVKPDGVQRGLCGEIMKRFEQRGFRLVAAKFIQVRGYQGSARAGVTMTTITTVTSIFIMIIHLMMVVMKMRMMMMKKVMMRTVSPAGL